MTSDDSSFEREVWQKEKRRSIVHAVIVYDTSYIYQCIKGTKIQGKTYWSFREVTLWF